LACVDGHIYPTFRLACEAWGLFHDDSEWIAAYQEMLDVRVMTLPETRRQFALMLLNLPATNSVALFNHFSVDLCGGIITLQSTAAALNNIQQHLLSVGRSLDHENFGFDLGAFPDVMLHADPDSDPEPGLFSGSDNLPQLSEEQLAAKRKIIGIIGSGETLAARSNVVAVVARAGTGKSVWVHHVAHELRLQSKSCICVAASALAATVLPAGQDSSAVPRQHVSHLE
jgi:hypothetical protein